jgi:hypothetical protein
MKSILKVAVAVALIATVTFTSCKRGGYGCPNELKLPKFSLTK